MMFLNPWLLAGAGAVVAPILIHMLLRRQVKRVKWAAMRFLQVVVQRNERKLRVEDLLLLLLRCLLLILLAIALARPALRAAAGMPFGGGGARTVVIALDNSYSMGLTDGGASRFDNGKKAAEQILGELPLGSSAAFLLFSDVARPVIAEPSPDLNLVRKLIGEAALTDRGSNVHPALREALDILKRHGEERGQIFLITDAQATGWSEMAAMRSEVAALGANGARVEIVVPGPGEQPNLGVSGLALGSALVPAGSAVRFAVQATNYGKQEARNVTVGLSIDGEAPSDQAVIGSIPPGETRGVSLFGKMKSAGPHSVAAQLPPDHLAADDRRTIIVQAVAEAPVLLVAGAMGATPREGDAFFLSHALAPVAEEDRAGYFIKPRIVGVADLGGLKLAGFAAVALVDVPRLDPAAVDALAKYVSDGGGLMIFPGEQTDAGFYNQALGKGLGLLPAAFGDAWGNAEGKEKYRVLQAGGYTHPMVSIWQDPASGTLTSARFYKGLTLTPLAAPASAGGEAGEPVTVLSYGDGSPAIVERSWGSGRVLEFSSTANAAWNDLPAHPAFVPLMQRALGRLVTRRDEALNLPVGGLFTYPARPAWLYKEMTVTGPEANQGAPDAGEKSTVGLIDGAPLVQYGDTDHAGVYTVKIGVQPPARLLFATQGDPGESRLDPLSDADLQTLGQGTQVVHWDAGTDMRRALGWEGNTQEFWTLFAALALGVACCETFLAGRFSAAK